MTISIEVNGNHLSGFSQASVSVSIAAASGGFQFKSSAQQGRPYPIKIDDKCVVLVDNIPVINGFVEMISPSYSGNNHTISITGRDKTNDLIDSTVGSKKEFQGPIGLETLCKLVLDGMGLSDIKVINKVVGLRSFTSEELASAEVGETGFNFLERYARQRQVLLSRDGLGNIEIVRNSNIRLKTKIVNVLGGTKNNTLGGSSTNDKRKRFNSYTIRAQGNPSSFGFDRDETQVADIPGDAFDTDVRDSRRIEIVSEKSLDADAARDRAIWEANIRRSRSLTAKYTMQGHSTNADGLWIPNRLVEVADDFNDIFGEMLIKNVTYTIGLGESAGSRTELDLVPPDAYTLEATEPGKNKKNDLFMESYEVPNVVQVKREL